MSMRQLESEILHELRRQPGCSRVRLMDIMEWSTSPVTAQGDEIVVQLPTSGYYVAYKPSGRRKA